MKDLRKSFDLFSRDVQELRILWIAFDTMFLSPKETIDIYNAAGPSFFSRLREWMADLIFLRISRLLDPSTQGKNRNLTAYTFRDLPETSTIQTKLDDQLKKLKNETKDFRAWRNKFIAHSDFETSQDMESLPEIEYSLIKDVVQNLEEYANTVELELFDSETGYAHTWPFGGPSDIIALLDKATKEET